MINYYLITKPGIVLGNLVTFAAGFILASRHGVDPYLMLFSLAAMGLIIASACIFNNYLDRERDQKMGRTKERPFARGNVFTPVALLLALALFIGGNGIFYLMERPEALIASDIAFAIYVFCYTLWKGKTVYGTAIGSIAGAFPPVIGYLAKSRSLDMGAALLFAMMVLWQMPHFYSIALMYKEDYSRAGIPVLPLVKGLFRTKIHIALYILAFLLVTPLLTAYGYAGPLFTLGVLLFGGMWLTYALMSFNKVDLPQWDRQMFRFSLVVINVLSFLIFIKV